MNFPHKNISLYKMSTPPDGVGVPPQRPPPPFNPRSNDARHPQPLVVTNPDGTERVFVRKAVQRRTIDYTANNLIAAANRAHASSVSKNPIRDDPFIKPTSGAMLDFSPSWCLRHQPASSFALKFVHVSANKIKTPINRGKKSRSTTSLRGAIARVFSCVLIFVSNAVCERVPFALTLSTSLLVAYYYYEQLYSCPTVDAC